MQIIYAEYRKYCSRIGEFTRSNVDFYAALLQEGLERKRTKDGVFVYGIKIKN